MSDLATVAKNPSAKGGRPTKDYLLNLKQTVYLASKSETAMADEVLIALVMVFEAFWSGRLVPAAVPVPAIDPFAAMAGRAGDVRDHLVAIAAIPALAREATHLPIWGNGRRPDWWSQYELRSFLTESHRQMTLLDCCREAQRRYGQSPSIAGLNRYWLKLDRVIGPASAPATSPRPPKQKKEAA